MNTVAVVLVVVFGVVNAEVRNESKSVQQNRDDNNVTIKGSGLNGSLLMDLQSLIAKLSAQVNETHDDGKNNGTDEHSRNASDSGKEEAKDLEKAITNKSEINNGINGDNTKGINILGNLRRIWADNPASDTEDSENGMKHNHDESHDHDHINDPQPDDFNRDGSSHNGNGYGASLNMKGRSGYVPNDQLIYHPLRRIVYHNQGHHQHASPSPITNYINHDLVNPINMFNNLLLRRADQGRSEETTHNNAEDILDDANSYKYEPEIKDIATQMLPWG